MNETSEALVCFIFRPGGPVKKDICSEETRSEGSDGFHIYKFGTPVPLEAVRFSPMSDRVFPNPGLPESFAGGSAGDMG